MKFGTALLIAAVPFLMACEGATDNKSDKTQDFGFDRKPLGELQAGVWIDPNGCDHWIIDDGVEGYLSPRLQADGTPVCSGLDLANTAIGNFKSGSSVQDPI